MVVYTWERMLVIRVFLFVVVFRRIWIMSGMQSRQLFRPYSSDYFFYFARS